MRTFPACLALLLSSALGAVAGKGGPPVPSAPPDWRFELVAEAPAISAPSVICCSPDGRIFVGQDLVDMGSPTDKPGDRILCIHPDGKINVFATNLHAVFGMQYMDGKIYVHHTPYFSVFEDKDSVGVHRVDLITNDNPHPWSPSFNDHIPSGITLAMDGYFYVSTGDKGIYGVTGPDGRKIEMRGGTYRMRPDGTGLEIYTTGTRNHLQVAINSEDEMFTYDNTDDGGGWWVRLTHMVDGGYYGYPYDYRPRKPYTLWMMTDWNGKTGAPTGGLCYDEDALPAEYRGDLFMLDWACQSVVRVTVKRSGATYEVVSRHLRPKKSNDDEDWVRPGDVNPFKPVGICVAPDGMGFYITDWGLNGWKNGEVKGRIFKLTYTGKSQAAPKPSWYLPAAMGKKFEASTAELVRGLSHPAESVRLVAQRRLAERHGAAEKKVEALVKNTKAPAYARWSAIWTLDAMDGGKAGRKTILAALKDKDPTVQAQAARELGTRQVKAAAGPLIDMLEGSTNAMLRFRAATALGRIGDRGAVRALKHALVQKDLFARYAAFKALNRIGLADGKAWPEIVAGFDSVEPQIREGTLFATRETYNVDLVKMLGAFSHLQDIPTEPRTNVLNLLSSLYHKPPPWNGDWWSTMPVNGSPPAKTADWEGTSVVAYAMRRAILDEQPAMRQIAFDWVKSSHDPNSAGMLRKMYEQETNVAIRASILAALPGGNDPDTRGLIGGILTNSQAPPILLDAALQVFQKMSVQGWESNLIHLAEKNSTNNQILTNLFEIFGKNKMSATAPLLGEYVRGANLDLRKAAVSALVQLGGTPAIDQFMPLLESQDADIREQAIASMGALRAKSAIPPLMKMASSNNRYTSSAVKALTEMPDLAAVDIYLQGLGSRSETIRSECKSALSSVRDGALHTIENRLLSTNGLPDDTIALLRDIYQFSPAAKRGVIFKARVKQVPIADYQNYALSHPGDPWHGREIFIDANGVNCARCHRIEGSGGQIGPDLTGIATKQDRAQIIESVLYPSKVILDGYQQVQFFTKDDDVVSGIVRSESADSVVVIDSLGKSNVLEKSSIRRRKVSKISLMPEGLQTGLSVTEFADLIAYVQDPNLRTRTRPQPEVRTAAAGFKTPRARTPSPPREPDPLAFLDLPSLPIDPPEPTAQTPPAASPVTNDAARFQPVHRNHPPHPFERRHIPASPRRSPEPHEADAPPSHTPPPPPPPPQRPNPPADREQ